MSGGVGVSLDPHRKEAKVPTDNERRRATKPCHQCKSRVEVFIKPNGRNGNWFCENGCGPEGLTELFRT